MDGLLEFSKSVREFSDVIGVVLFFPALILLLICMGWRKAGRKPTVPPFPENCQCCHLYNDYWQGCDKFHNYNDRDCQPLATRV